MARPNGTKDIKTAEELWTLFEAYLKKLKDNPFKVKDWVGKDGDMVYREKERPVTMEGFRVFGYDHGVTIKNYFDNQNGNYDDYYTICSRIRDYIRNEQIEGGMAGMYNPSITQRLNSLVEKTDVTSDGQKLETVKIEIVTSNIPIAKTEGEVSTD